GESPMHRSTVVSLCAASLLLAACASMPRTPNKFGHYHDYPYQTPPQVSEADADECGQRADTEAFAATSEISDRAGVLFGAIGAAVQIARIKHKLNSTYKQVMKDCLREKGYELSERDDG
ncbi:MAG: hypothetical protein ACRES3_00825, partial [Steroidobacteraceae bacterium]